MVFDPTQLFLDIEDFYKSTENYHFWPLADFFTPSLNCIP